MKYASKSTIEGVGNRLLYREIHISELSDGGMAICLGHGMERKAVGKLILKITYIWDEGRQCHVETLYGDGWVGQRGFNGGWDIWQGCIGGACYSVRDGSAGMWTGIPLEEE